MEEDEKNECANIILNELIKKKSNISYKDVEEIFRYTIDCLKEKITLQSLL